MVAYNTLVISLWSLGSVLDIRLLLEGQQSMEHAGLLHVVAVAGSLSHGASIEVIELHGAALIVVDLHARCVGCHLTCHPHHALGQRGAQGSHAAGLCRLNDLAHETMTQGCRVGVGHQLIGSGIEGYGQSVETHVPYSLLPSCLVVFHLGSLHAGVVEFVDQCLDLVLVGAVVVANVQVGMRLTEKQIYMEQNYTK